jgi:hypothetical protein
MRAADGPLDGKSSVKHKWHQLLQRYRYRDQYSMFLLSNDSAKVCFPSAVFGENATLTNQFVYRVLFPLLRRPEHLAKIKQTAAFDAFQ